MALVRMRPRARAVARAVEGWLSGFRMVSGGVGCCRVGVGLVSGWCRVGVGCCRAWRCRVGVKGCRGCQSVRMCTHLQGLSVLSGCRVVEFWVLLGGVGLSGLCRGEQPYFVVSGLHQGLTQTTTNKELRNRTQHAYLEIYASQISLNPRSSVRLRPFKALKKLFDLHRNFQVTCESSQV